MANTPYYDYAYGLDSLCISVPFLLALLVFYCTYIGFFKSYSHRIRNKKLAARYVFSSLATGTVRVSDRQFITSHRIKLFTLFCSHS